MATPDSPDLARDPWWCRCTVVAASTIIVAGTVAFTAPAPAPAFPSAAPRPASTTPAAAAPRAGAQTPFTTLEAEDAATNGTVIGPDLAQGGLASEASGRRGVTLEGPGRYVEFTLGADANALTVSGNVPDGSSGEVAVSVNGQRLPSTLQVTSKYSYVDTPGIVGSTTHHLFDHARLLLGRDLHAGDTVRLEPESVSSYTVDVADFEQVAPAPPAPRGSVSVLDAGADPTGAQDSAQAFTAAIEQAKAAGTEVWVPEGRFRIDAPLAVDQVTITGAGPWRSVLASSHLIDQTEATGGVRLRDFAVIGEVTDRVDDSPDNFVNGSLGAGSEVTGLWLQHLKVGLWLTGNNDDLLVEGNRILDTTADGLNLNGSANRVRVRENFLRNTGDDALAMWSLNAANSGSEFTGNTVVAPNLANGIAIYGGTDLTVRDNLVADTNALGSGIAISNQAFGDPFFPLRGTITVAGNELVRTGAMNPNWQHPMGAVRVDAFDSPIEADVAITDTTATDSPYGVFEFVSGGGQAHEVRGVTIDGATLRGWAPWWCRPRRVVRRR
ncbi:glycosyl hydrolase family 28-related protein [Saccharopolyspora gloriosae]|uniref:glycosyl hydrolase family 28-related protein n=1 Tax=Saccharopolyspora gloriosae TaxID=455344 RepID=UPI001FB75100|nr:glycosyl hydrolase family 28-related protein [Saccharopolyspora gloriosae]